MIKNLSGSNAHPMGDNGAQRFRAQATGIGKTQTASQYTGMRRAQRVVDTPDARLTTDSAPTSEGFPARTPMGNAIGGYGGYGYGCDGNAAGQTAKQGTRR